MVLCGVLCAGVIGGGCASGETRVSRGVGIEPRATEGAAVQAEQGADERWVREPATTGERLEVHPLTRVGTDANGRLAVIVHLDVRDEFGQSIKVLGEVVVLLVRGDGRVERTWTVDLTDPKTNAAMFDDLVTRTYVLALGGVPEWLGARARGDVAGADVERSGERATVRVAWRLVQGEVQGPELRASREIVR